MFLRAKLRADLPQKHPTDYVNFGCLRTGHETGDQGSISESRNSDGRRTRPQTAGAIAAGDGYVRTDALASATLSEAENRRGRKPQRVFACTRSRILRTAAKHIADLFLFRVPLLIALPNRRQIFHHGISQHLLELRIAFSGCLVDCIHPRKDEIRFSEDTQLYIDPIDCIAVHARRRARYGRSSRLTMTISPQGGRYTPRRMPAITILQDVTER